MIARYHGAHVKNMSLTTCFDGLKLAMYQRGGHLSRMSMSACFGWVTDPEGFRRLFRRLDRTGIIRMGSRRSTLRTSPLPRPDTLPGLSCVGLVVLDTPPPWA